MRRTRFGTGFGALIAIAGLSAPAALVGCEENEAEEAVDDAQDAAEDAGDAVEDAVDDAGDAIDDATDGGM